MAYKYEPPESPPTVNVTQQDIQTEFRRWNQQAGETIIGAFDFPPSPQIGGKDATVRFEFRGRARSLTCARWGDYRTNLRCIYLVIRDRRLAEARGIADLAAQMYTALPPAPADDDPYAVLGVSRNDGQSLVVAAYRRKSQEAHPDAGGSDAAQTRVNLAWDKIKSERGWR